MHISFVRLVSGSLQERRLVHFAKQRPDTQSQDNLPDAPTKGLETIKEGTGNVVDQTETRQRIEGTLRKPTLYVNGHLESVDLDTVQRALLAAVEKGVEYKDGVFTFFDPGIAISDLRELPIVREKKLLDHVHYPSNSCELPQERALRFPVRYDDKYPSEASFNIYRERLPVSCFLPLQKGEEVAPTRVAVLFFIIHALATRERLPQRRSWVGTAERVPRPTGWPQPIWPSEEERPWGEHRVIVGNNGEEGLNVDSKANNIVSLEYGLAVMHTPEARKENDEGKS